MGDTVHRFYDTDSVPKRLTDAISELKAHFKISKCERVIQISFDKKGKISLMTEELR